MEVFPFIIFQFYHVFETCAGGAAVTVPWGKGGIRQAQKGSYNPVWGQQPKEQSKQHAVSEFKSHSRVKFIFPSRNPL